MNVSICHTVVLKFAITCLYAHLNLINQSTMQISKPLRIYSIKNVNKTVFTP